MSERKERRTTPACKATREELLLIIGKTVESDCVVCMDSGILCRVGYHPSGKGKYFRYHIASLKFLL
jgi:hypothetical protein